MNRRLAAVVLSACALCAVVPSTAPAAEVGPPDVEWVAECLTYGGPPNGPVEPALYVAGCYLGVLT